MDKHYTLTSKHLLYTAGSNKPTYIGQVQGCDIHIDNPTQYVDETFAKIEVNSGGDGWHMVRLSKRYNISVNGLQLGRVCYLNDGDTIDIDGCRYRYNVHDGLQPSTVITHIHSDRRTTWMLASLVTFIAIVAGLYLNKGQRQLSDEMIDDVSESLYKIRVDSIQLIHGDSIAESYIYASPVVGTAFLTKDSLLVTARHCVEPWLNVRFDEVRSTNTSDCNPVSMAIRVETYNQLSGADDERLVSFMTFEDANGEGQPKSVASVDFIIDKSRDEIIEMGGYDTDLYWRSIARRFGLEGMALGDIAYMKMDTCGVIEIAKRKQIEKRLRPRYPLTFMGFPQTQNSEETWNSETDELRQPLRYIDGELFLLEHGGQLSHGFSGGPVMMRDGSSVYAVGVISVLDDRNAHRSYSVPITSLKR